MKDVWKKTSDLLDGGVPMVWIIDPTTLESELRTSGRMKDAAPQSSRNQTRWDAAQSTQ